ncbi:hypothetical protein Bca52824_039828 [Brassica carinata]|uniref:Uncharacterized protein n=2 Tax=Brassica TaxID=3705 RepID=A0A8X7UWC1_BRACI|nr:hypothetical protein Bca52824_039828 [Brassica carinata]
MRPLKEDIREGLESTEFATRGELFQEAAEVEEIMDKEKTAENFHRRRDTRVEVDEDDMSDDAVVSGELMIYKDTDEEGEHGAVEQTRSGSGPGEAGSGSAPSSATTGSNSTVVGDSVIGGSVANSSASGVASVAGSFTDSSPSVAGSFADSSPSVAGSFADSSPSVAGSNAN